MRTLKSGVQSFVIYRKEPLDLVNQLLEKGADVNLSIRGGQTPLQLAEKRAQDTMVLGREKLIELVQAKSVTVATDREAKKTDSSFRPGGM